MRDRFDGIWPWWCCGQAVKKSRRIDRKRAERAWRKFDRIASM
jgi:hypothetical protein